MTILSNKLLVLYRAPGQDPIIQVFRTKGFLISGSYITLVQGILFRTLNRKCHGS